MRLIALQSSLHLLYGERDGKSGKTPKEKARYLGIALFDLWQAVEGHMSKETIAQALARIVSRVMVVASTLKIPIQDSEIVVQDSAQASSISSLQDSMQMTNHMVFDSNGLMYIITPIIKNYEGVVSMLEITEKSGNYDNMILPLLKQKILDIIIYSMVIANHYGINLENALYERYGSGCRKCEKDPCICEDFDSTPINWATKGA